MAARGMKGLDRSFAFTARILVSVFIIAMIVVLVMHYLPEVFGGDYCRSQQAGSVNSLINDAERARSLEIKGFTVENCMQHVSFGEIPCNPMGDGGLSEVRRCYEFLPVGQTAGNCADEANIGSIRSNSAPVQLCKDRECAETISCSTPGSEKRGTYLPLPGGYDSFQIDMSAPTKLTPGKYIVEVRPFSLRFIPKQ